MVETVFERGYEATTVRELARAAGVSTRTFYQHYSDKEACFLRTHQILLRRALGWLKASHVGVQDWKDRVLLGVNAIAQGWARDPKAAHFVLIDSYSVGPKAVEQLRRASRSMMKGSITDARIDGSSGKIPSVLSDGIIAGVHEVVRLQLEGKKRPFTGDLSDGLGRWALSYFDPLVTQLDQLNRPGDLKYVSEEDEVAVFTGDAGALLSAAAKIAVDKGHEELTPRRIFTTAGVPRRNFYEIFPHVDDCLMAVLELYIDSAVRQARRASENGLTQAGGVYLAVLSLCARVARDHIFAGLCFDENVSSSVAKVRCRGPLRTGIAYLVEDVLGADKLVAQASAGAFWGVLQREVTIGRAQNVPRLASTLSYFMLAPNVGASAAVEAICQERMMARKREQASVVEAR